MYDGLGSISNIAKIIKQTQKKEPWGLQDGSVSRLDVFSQLDTARVIWEKGISTEELPPPAWHISEL